MGAGKYLCPSFFCPYLPAKIDHSNSLDLVGRSRAKGLASGHVERLQRLKLRCQRLHVEASTRSTQLTFLSWSRPAPIVGCPFRLRIDAVPACFPSQNSSRLLPSPLHLAPARPSIPTSSSLQSTLGDSCHKLSHIIGLNRSPDGAQRSTRLDASVLDEYPEPFRQKWLVLGRKIGAGKYLCLSFSCPYLPAKIDHPNSLVYDVMGRRSCQLPLPAFSRLK